MNSEKNNTKQKKLTRIEKMLEAKPDLKLCPNHFRPKRNIHRAWLSESQDTAIRDDKGWYKQIEPK